MQRLAAGGLDNLLAATEAVGDDQCVARGVANLWQQDSLADAHGDLVVIALESERAGHSAASGVRLLDIESDLAHYLQLGLELHDRRVMTMRLHERFALQARQLEPVALTIDEFAQRHRSLAEALGVFVRGEK